MALVKFSFKTTISASVSIGVPHNILLSLNVLKFILTFNPLGFSTQFIQTLIEKNTFPVLQKIISASKLFVHLTVFISVQTKIQKKK
jgi:hypothetical protein